MKNKINERKIEHIKIINNDPATDRQKYYFDLIRLKNRALPELDLTEIDTSVDFMGKKLSFPLLISSMTGGDHELVRKINKNLALAAEETHVAMAVGSQRIMFADQNARESFKLREYAPQALLFSNLGAVQLNYGFSIKECEQAVKILKADALYFHLNPLQEAVQPEGDTNFSDLVEKIQHITETLSVPVILKEVGAGISSDDVEQVIDRGIRFIDVAGTGGTSWSRIEQFRHKDRENDLGIQFQDWGIPTPIAIYQLRPYMDKISIIASGGLRSGIDMVKSMVLGTSICGMASPFLKPAMESKEKVCFAITKLYNEFRTAMFLLGASKVSDLRCNDSLILDTSIKLS